MNFRVFFLTLDVYVRQSPFAKIILKPRTWTFLNDHNDDGQHNKTQESKLQVEDSQRMGYRSKYMQLLQINLKAPR